jgi:hypothetical protein
VRCLSLLSGGGNWGIRVLKIPIDGTGCALGQAGYGSQLGQRRLANLFETAEVPQELGLAPCPYAGNAFQFGA